MKKNILNYEELIEKTIRASEKLAGSKKQKIHPLHFLFSLIKDDETQSSKVLSEYSENLEKLIATLPSDLTDDKTFMDQELKDWIGMAKTSALRNQRDLVKESDFLDNMDQFFKSKKMQDLVRGQAKETPAKIESKTFAPDYKELSEKRAEVSKSKYLEKLEVKSDLLVENETILTELIESLSRQECNDVVIYGEMGVGKTSIVKTLAQRISQGRVPSFLKNKTIYRLKTAQITLNTPNSRDVSDRIEEVLKFIKESPESRILFISDFDLCLKNQTILDNIKYYLLEYHINVIAEMSYDKFDIFSRDTQFKNQFNTIFVKEPSIEESILVVEKIVPSYEVTKGLFISKEVVQAAVELSAKHITGQFLPSKAINVLDQSCAKFMLHLEMPNSDEAQAQDKVNQLQGAIKYSKDKNKVTELETAVKKLEELKTARESKVAKLKSVTLLQYEVNQLKEKPSLTEEETKTLNDKEVEILNIRDEVSLNRMDVCEVISNLSDIPKEKIAQSKQENILNMDKDLEKRVFGQSEAITKVTDILMTSFAGLSAEQKPMGSFLFLGPSGVGKTELAKAVAEVLFGSERSMIRMDLSEYKEEHALAKLIGAPAGYAGYEEGGVLTEAVRKNPYSVILFDEVEKGHKNFADILLQILDDGRLTDNKGRTVNFNNTIIFLTSNLKDPTTYFRLEMIGRFSDVVKFNPLAMTVMPLLVNKELKGLNKKLAKRNLKVEITKDVVDHLGVKGYSEHYGARPMIKLFNDQISKPLGKEILAGKLQEGNVVVELVNEEIVFKAS